MYSLKVGINCKNESSTGVARKIQKNNQAGENSNIGL